MFCSNLFIYNFKHLFRQEYPLFKSTMKNFIFRQELQIQLYNSLLWIPDRFQTPALLKFLHLKK